MTSTLNRSNILRLYDPQFFPKWADLPRTFVDMVWKARDTQAAYRNAFRFRAWQLRKATHAIGTHRGIAHMTRKIMEDE